MIRPHIEIKTTGAMSEIFIDGKHVSGIRKIEFVHEPHKVPILRLDLIATDCTFDGDHIKPELPDMYKRFYAPIEN